MPSTVTPAGSSTIATNLPARLVAELQAVLGPRGWSMEQDVLAKHNREARNKFTGMAELVLYPANTGEVAQCARLCHEAGIALVPQGGNTGRCGGAVADPGQILINLARMDKILETDARDFTMTVQAGAILHHIQQAAEDHDLLFPLSLGAQGSCQIGGNIATNAGGLNVIRYGNTRDLVLGLEVVLADGTVWNGLSKLRKDNTGYDLRDMFIGAEGTLGIITACTLKLFPRPRHLATAWVALPGIEAALDLLALARRETGDAIAAFELMSQFAQDLCISHIQNCITPLETRAPWYAMIEITSSRPRDDLASVLEGVLERALEGGFILDGTIAQSEKQRANLWAIREGIPEAQTLEGGSIKHDVSVPVSAVPALIEQGIKQAQKRIPGIRPCPFGHVGDGNIHFNFSQPENMPKAEFLAHWEDLNRDIHDIVAGLGGSISAEHGIGRLKVDELVHYADPAKIKLLAAIKQALDPQNTLNPGKVINHK
ncbi:FAD-binding oxidoreductase [Thalassospira marina]|uniref:Hydroxyacid dehydrogenase n=1 Tax=Thalassospira marina TaxID=2048283 RepID=A0ABM6Q742_9PROT|nr:FAD-binding oxidoreductase [Thalassospira marina]AUG52338.1 hydroxyacid dehydrogenase [Thalassospira marina]